MSATARGNEAERLALLETHRGEVLERLAQVNRNLELIDYKIDLYRQRVEQEDKRPC